MLKNLMTLAALSCAVLAVTGCSRSTIAYRSGSGVAIATETSHSKKNGPPPHAPAHGYRHKHGDVVLVYEKSLEVYVVDDYPGYYFEANIFYRQIEGAWQTSSSVHGPWKKVKVKKLPPGLREWQEAQGHGKGKAKGKVK